MILNVPQADDMQAENSMRKRVISINSYKGVYDAEFKSRRILRR